MAITLTPLIGAHDTTGILSYLLEIDEGRILLDCGCPDRTSGAQIDRYLKTLSELTPTLDLVLLSHPILSSLGLVPLLRARLGLRCPIYATLPTKEMGRWAVEEWIAQRGFEEPNGLEEDAPIDHPRHPSTLLVDSSLQDPPTIEPETSLQCVILSPSI